MLVEGMLLKHTKEVLVDVLPRVLRYSIPLYLPEEIAHFKTKTLVIDVPRVELEYVELKRLEEAYRAAPKTVSLIECAASQTRESAQPIRMM